MRTTLLVVHVLGAIVALGFSLSYALWIGRGEAAGGSERAFALQTVSWIDRRVTTPAFVLQLVTGMLLVAVTDWGRLRQTWLAVSLALYVALTALAITKFAPAHRAQTAIALRAIGGDDIEPEYAHARAASRRWGVVVTTLTVVIAVLMVWKPDGS
ncbi:MAG: DUF2269 family protein [Actinomycetota bacterium]